MLELRSYTKTYHGKNVLHIPYCKLENNVYWVQGVNGSGKTTLLKSIAGLIPFDGDIALNNINSKTSPVEYRRLISWAEAEPLYPDFVTGLELINLYKNIRNVPARDVDKLIEVFGVGSFIKNATGSYSNGMLKKLSLLLAFTGKTNLIVLDEPLITLDAASLQVVCALISERHNEAGTMFLLSSHQPPETATLHSAKTLMVKAQQLIYTESTY
ncbi:ATP-binding cassette domain-containing protein [Panacibacter sp. DH6]|uniref:ATP-binding cassette domain-containing protein n=1 Tax=Panacibacter microcysteis TaxID=2793269 RepID=A0A931MED9_9BACT|nr:ATP-binding cassette domain-containing protein [Panacibacter microcysteis]MBG9378219.1 ATP-binding cassette domain-containing protein [Panacibacter microcysteis]